MHPALLSSIHPFLRAFLTRVHVLTLILERVATNEVAVLFHVATHHSVGGPGLELNLLFLQSLYAELAPPTQVWHLHWVTFTGWKVLKVGEGAS